MTAKLVRRFRGGVSTARAIAPPVSHGLGRWMRDEAGITAIEYALLASLIALAIVGAVSGLSTTIQNVFDDLATSL